MAVDDSIEIGPQDIVTTHTGDGTHVTHVSAVSFATGSTDELRQQQERQTNVFGAEVTSYARPTPGEGGSIATGNTERTAGGTRKVHRDDVRYDIIMLLVHLPAVHLYDTHLSMFVINCYFLYP